MVSSKVIAGKITSIETELAQVRERAKRLEDDLEYLRSHQTNRLTDVIGTDDVVQLPLGDLRLTSGGVFIIHPYSFLSAEMREGYSQKHAVHVSTHGGGLKVVVHPEASLSDLFLVSIAPTYDKGWNRVVSLEVAKLPLTT